MIYNLFSIFYAVAVTAGHNRVIAHPGQDAELICSLSQTLGSRHSVGWLVDYTGPYGINSLYNGLLDGYSAHFYTTSIIILNIMMNDSRNGTEYQCGIIYIRGLFLEQESDPITLYVTGEFQ